MMVIMRMEMLMTMVTVISVMMVTGHRDEEKAVVNPRLCPGLTFGSQVVGEAKSIIDPLRCLLGTRHGSASAVGFSLTEACLQDSQEGRRLE